MKIAARQFDLTDLTEDQEPMANLLSIFSVGKKFIVKVHTQIQTIELTGFVSRASASQAAEQTHRGWDGNLLHLRGKHSLCRDGWKSHLRPSRSLGLNAFMHPGWLEKPPGCFFAYPRLTYYISQQFSTNKVRHPHAPAALKTFAFLPIPICILCQCML
jgi:hypothetical protein